jgi:hypothetical protein
MNEDWAIRKDRANENRRLAYLLAHQATREQKAAYRAKQAEAHRAHRAEQASRKTRSTKDNFLLDAKRKPCMDCGNVFIPDVLEFDHREPHLKEFTISKAKGEKLSRLQAEIAKCDLVCANCHRVRESRRRKGLPATPPPEDYVI